MHASRRLRGAGRRSGAAPASDDDVAAVRDYARAITQACIDLIDVPLDHNAQQTVIELLLHQAPAAEEAMARLTHAGSPL